MAMRCLVQEGIAAQLSVVAEEDVPQWLWRREPAQAPITNTSKPRENRGETSLKQVIYRIAGAWTYEGWKGGYFDTEADSRAFFDEVRWLICHRRISPNPAQWRNTGLHWAYGLSTDATDSFVTDYRTAAVRRAEAGDIPPHGAVINGTHGALSGEGGVWDLWERETRIMSRGGQCGANVSSISGRGDLHTGSAMPEILRIGDAAAAIVDGQTPVRTSPHRHTRRLTLDATHPDALVMADQPLSLRSLWDATNAGIAISLRHIQAIIDAAPEVAGKRRAAWRDSATLRFAIQSARQAHLPESLIQQTLDCLAQGQKINADDIFGLVPRPGATAMAAPGDSITIFAVDDETMDGADTKSADSGSLMDAIARNGWMGIPSGLQFETATNGWNTCLETGPIRAASGDGSFQFLDDTASAPAFLNALTFLEDDCSVNPADLKHATALLTIALDISVMVTTQPTPRLAKRSWDFRPLSLSPTGIASLLMARGLAYDSPEGRAFGQAFCALMTGVAYLTSTQLAEELGAFPGYTDNAHAMGRVMQRHAGSVTGDNAPYLPDDWQREISNVWQSVLEGGQRNGFRNAQVSLIAQSEDETTLMDGDSPGLCPVPALVCWRREACGAYARTLNPSVLTALRTLGYGEAAIDAILNHVRGHGTLIGAPGVNHETLKKRGFTDAALRSVEPLLATTQDIGLVFNSAVLGEAYCTHMLGFTAEELQGDRFDMLAALGFSDAGIEAANTYCCGADTLEGAPHLTLAHVAVFDCARTQGDRGRRQVSTGSILRMMEAAQPALSGAIAHVLTLPATATLDDCRDAIFQAWRGGLKSLVFHRRSDDRPAPVADQPDSDTDTVLTIVRSAQPQGIRITEIATADGAGIEPEVASQTGYEIAVTDREETPAGDAEAPRRATSLPTQSTASVTSSADAVVEQRQV
jgi:ribonucleoside-diphosphate reductase alpha chain